MACRPGFSFLFVIETTKNNHEEQKELANLACNSKQTQTDGQVAVRAPKKSNNGKQEGELARHAVMPWA